MPDSRLQANNNNDGRGADKAQALAHRPHSAPPSRLSGRDPTQILGVGAAVAVAPGRLSRPGRERGPGSGVTAQYIAVVDTEFDGFGTATSTYMDESCVSDRFARGSQPHAASHAPCDVLYLHADRMLIAARNPMV